MPDYYGDISVGYVQLACCFVPLHVDTGNFGSSL